MKFIGTMAALALGLNACEMSPASIGGVPPSPPAILTLKTPQALQPPMRMFLGIDDSMSVGESKIPRMTIENIQPLLDLIKKQGGELRAAAVCTNSDLRMTSFYVPEPPIAPQQPAKLPKAGTVIALNLPKLRQEHRQAEKIYQQELAVYDQSMTEREQKAQRESAEFTIKMGKILEKPPSCLGSDLVGLVKRGDLYLSETGKWQQMPKNIALVVTDGLETMQKHPEKVDFRSKPQVLVVSSGGQVGILQSLMGSDKPYESIEGAVRFITGS
jgi:hypothetical protein